MEAEIKLIKWGIIFLGEPGRIKFNTNFIEITKADGSVAFSCSLGALKRANYNSNNGMITLKSSNGQKCNISFKDDESAQKFGELLDKADVKGLSV